MSACERTRAALRAELVLPAEVGKAHAVTVAVGRPEQGAWIPTAQPSADRGALAPWFRRVLIVLAAAQGVYRRLWRLTVRRANAPGQP